MSLREAFDTKAVVNPYVPHQQQALGSTVHLQNVVGVVPKSGDPLGFAASSHPLLGEGLVANPAFFGVFVLFVRRIEDIVERRVDQLRLARIQASPPRLCKYRCMA